MLQMDVILTLLKAHFSYPLFDHIWIKEHPQNMFLRIVFYSDDINSALYSTDNQQLLLRLLFADSTLKNNFS